MNRLTRVTLASILAVAAASPVVAQNALHRVPPDQVGAYWAMTKSEVDGDVPNFGRNLDKPGCAAVSYMIGSDGVPRDVVARKVVPAHSDFGSIAVSLVRNFRYAVAGDNAAGQPIATYYVVRFNLPKDPAARKAILDQCALPGYAQR